VGLCVAAGAGRDNLSPAHGFGLSPRCRTGCNLASPAWFASAAGYSLSVRGAFGESLFSARPVPTRPHREGQGQTVHLLGTSPPHQNFGFLKQPVQLPNQLSGFTTQPVCRINQVSQLLNVCVAFVRKPTRPIGLTCRLRQPSALGFNPTRLFHFAIHSVKHPHFCTPSGNVPPLPPVST
jgi:hypothetical protein